MKTIMAAITCFCIAAAAWATTNEITVQVYLKADKNSVQIERKPGTLQIQMIGSRWQSYVVPCTITNTPLSKGAVGNLGWAYCRNLSTNQTVALSFDNGATTNMHLLSGECALWRFAPAFQMTNVSAAVTAGAGDFEVTILEQ